MYNHHRKAIHAVMDNDERAIKMYCPTLLSVDEAQKIVKILFPMYDTIFFQQFTDNVAPELQSNVLVEAFGTVGYIFAIANKPPTKKYIDNVFEEKVI